MRDSTRQGVTFTDVFHRPVAAAFDEGAQTSDAGLLLLGALDRQVHLTAGICAQLSDARAPGKVDHSVHDLLRQRVYGIAAGYADCNDARTLRHDPALRLLCDRDPVHGDSLASQPTLSRFETSRSPREVVQASRYFESAVIGRLAVHHPKAACVVIDLDATEDQAHGQQAFAFFNAFYDSRCFLPLLGFVSVEGHPEQHLFHARLRPGIGAAGRGVIPMLRRAVEHIRRVLPRARIRVRTDAGFCSPLLLRALRSLRVEYVIGLAANVKLLRLCKPFLRGLRRKVQSTGMAARRYAEVRYAAKTWDADERVVVKVEYLPPPADGGDGKIKRNVRFVVTSEKTAPKRLYERTYCGRGDSENRIKELKHDLSLDRTSCMSFVANQFRVLMTSVAFALFQELRLELKSSELARAQTHTLRLALVKIGARVVASVRRIVFHMPRACPMADLWSKLAMKWRAAPA